MKCFIFLALLSCVLYQVSAIDDAVNRQACIRDASVNPNLIDKAYNGQISDVRQLQCYFKCYYENAGYMNSKGEIQEDKLRANIPTGISRTMASRAIDLCKSKKGRDGCETAYLTQKCFLNNNMHY